MNTFKKISEMLMIGILILSFISAMVGLFGMGLGIEGEMPVWAAYGFIGGLMGSVLSAMCIGIIKVEE